MTLSDPFEGVPSSQRVPIACFTAQGLNWLSAASHDRNHQPISEDPRGSRFMASHLSEYFRCRLLSGRSLGTKIRLQPFVTKKFVQWEAWLAQIVSLAGHSRPAFWEGRLTRRTLNSASHGPTHSNVE
jgi:hypothetical protein